MPLFTAAVAAFSVVSTFIGGLGAVGSFLLRAAVGIGINLLAQAVAGKPKDPTFAINGTLQGGGDLPRSFLIGKSSTAGSLVWANSWGKDGDTPNGYLTQVIAVSDLPIGGLTGLWVNNEKVTINPTAEEYGFPIQEYIKDGNKNLWIKFYDGNQTVADSFLINRASNGNRQWAATRVGYGVAYAIVTARVSKNMFSGIPSFKFECDGAKLYDISKDSTAGGSGSQRFSTPSTWGGDGDHLPAVQAYSLLRGLTWNNKWFYGVQGMSAARLPPAQWISQINKCRALIQGAHGWEPMYRAGGEISIDAPLSSALEALNTACQGRVAEIGGTYNMFVGAPDAPVIGITDDDILSTDEQSFTPFFGLSDTINGISATHPSPVDGWVAKTAPPLYRTDLEARHGNRRLMASVSLDFVPYAEQVQRLMKSALDEGQRARRHTIVLPPKFWAYCTPGMIIAWTSKRNGYINKLMRIDGVADRANLDVMVDITEVDPSDYDWHSDSDFRPPIDGMVGPMRPLPQPIVDFSAMPDVAQDSNGNNRRCAIMLGWDGDKIDVDMVRFEVRLQSNFGVVYTGRTEDVARGSILIAPGILLPNTDYAVKAQYYTYAGNRLFEWSDWIPVRTLDIRFGPLDIYPIDIGQLNKDINGYLEWVGEGLRYVQEEMDRIGAMATEQDGGNYLDKQQLRTEMSLTATGLRADYTLQITAAVGPGSAIASRIETLEVQVNEDIATAVDFLTTEINTVNGRVTANAEAVTALSVTVDGVSANLTIRGQVMAAPSGWSARYGVQVGGSGAGWSSAAFFLDWNSTTNISRAVFNADQIIFTNGVNSQAPMTFIGGALALQVANIGDVTAGIIRSPDNKFVINLAQGTMRISD